MLPLKQQLGSETKDSCVWAYTPGSAPGRGRHHGPHQTWETGSLNPPWPLSPHLLAWSARALPGCPERTDRKGGEDQLCPVPWYLHGTLSEVKLPLQGLLPTAFLGPGSLHAQGHASAPSALYLHRPGLHTGGHVCPAPPEPHTLSRCTPTLFPLAFKISRPRNVKRNKATPHTH